MLTRLKNVVVVTGDSKNLVATALGWNQSLIAAMYFQNNNKEIVATKLSVFQYICTLQFYSLLTYLEDDIFLKKFQA